MTLSISVVTPSYNQGQFIERTLQSVLGQESPAEEYVVYDGGSTDQTVAVLNSFGTRVRWASARDRGQSEAVNKGIRSTHGDIIGWLNSDDIYYPGALALVREFFESHPDVDVVYGRSNHIDEHEQVIEPYPTEAWSLERMKELCIISQPAAFFRRRIVERLGALDENLQYALDYEFWLRLALGGARFAYLPQVLAATRIHPATKTNALKLKCHREINNMLAKKLGRVPDRWIFTYAHVVLESRGVTRKQPLRFLFLFFVNSIAASINWNSRLTWGLLKLNCQWIRHHVRHAFRGGERAFRLPSGAQ
ncbi:MAG: glycosyltransferase [Planctomycetes bacterium]|nr:glycosyltransferase [Planctomycetota bacterium]